MAKGHKPKAGSRAFWPRKRAKRIYPRLRTSKESVRITKSFKDPRPVAFAACKAGMTQAFFTDNRKGTATEGQELSRAVTVLDCPPLYVFGIKLYSRKAGALRDIGTVISENLKKEISRKLPVPEKRKKPDFSKYEKMLDDAHTVRLMVHTQPKESGNRKKKPEIFELDVAGEDVKKKWEYAKEKLGKDLEVNEVFSEGEYVDAKAVDKGKGFQGPVKRYGVTIRTRKDHGKRRHIGNMGAVTPGRVLPGKVPLAGQLGFQTRTEYNKRIMKIGSEGFSPSGGFVNYGKVPKNFILLEGSVPGPKKRLIMFRKAFRKTAAKEPVEISGVSLVSQQ